MVEQKRVETGPMRFGDDWAGVFVRGDNAFAFASAVAIAANDIKDQPFLKARLHELVSVLSSAQEPCEAQEANLCQRVL